MLVYVLYMGMVPDDDVVHYSMVVLDNSMGHYGSMDTIEDLYKVLHVHVGKEENVRFKVAEVDTYARMVFDEDLYEVHGIVDHIDGILDDVV